jgi:predicted nucleic acid-binding protein
MIVVADTSPLNYLIIIGHDGILPKLYAQVLVPPEVLHELSHPDTPDVVRSWLKNPPTWLEVRGPSGLPDEALRLLDPGERQAIQLAEEQLADLLLIDERRGSQEAKRRGLTTTGTIEILLAAGVLGLIDSKEALRRLITETTFRVTPEIRAKFLS